MQLCFNMCRRAISLREWSYQDYQNLNNLLLRIGGGFSFFTLLLLIISLILRICGCCKSDRAQVNIQPTNEAGAIAGLSNTSRANGYERHTPLNRTGGTHFPQAHRTPEAFVPRETRRSRPVRQVNPSTLEFPSASVPGGGRPTQELVPPSYETVVRMKDIENRQTERY